MDKICSYLFERIKKNLFCEKEPNYKAGAAENDYAL